jgi:ornithine cyclodeaminase/alanine dehydrogenase-like protein (mu-crystallin family)
VHEPQRTSPDLVGLPAVARQPLLVGAEALGRALTLEMAFESQVMAFMSLAQGDATLPPRVRFTDGGVETICHLGRIAPDAGVVVQLVSVAEGNLAWNLPMVNGTVAVIDPRTGLLAALMDGTTLTTLRTAAASAVAAAALGREPARRLAVIGSGVQGRAHARAIAKAVSLRQVRIYSRDADHLRDAVRELEPELGLDLAATTSVEEAARGADVVALCTHSPTPVLLGDWVEPGAVVISVGSFAPDRSEVDDVLLERAGRIVVDQREAEVRHAGPILRAIDLGLVRPEHLVELGQVLVGEDPGRRDAAEVIFYNSVGIGVQDAAAAWLALQRVRELGLGTPLDLR